MTDDITDELGDYYDDIYNNPNNKKLQNAIKEVASEGNYTYIFTSEILHYAAESNDIGPLVKKELGL